MLTTILITVIVLLSIVLIYSLNQIKQYKQGNLTVSSKMIDNMKYINEQIQSLNNPIRRGYYTLNTIQTHKDADKLNVECIIFVKEIDRYTNGDSKLEFEDVNMICENSNFISEPMRKFIINNFRIIRKTTDVTWVESETDIKDARKNKLDKIKKSLKE